MITKRVYKRLGRGFLFIALNLCFSAGVIYLAYANRVRIKKWMDHKNSFSKEDKVIMYDLFTSPLIKDKQLLVFPPVKNSDELISDLYKSTLHDSLDLWKIYDSCKVLSVDQYNSGVLRIKYLLFKDTLDSYAFFRKLPQTGKKTNKAVIYFAGSGDNKTINVAQRLIAREDPAAQAEQIGADIYFPVFPGNSILAISDGVKMLDISKIEMYLVTIHRNISLRYLANIFALKKYLQNDYSVLHIWGHSRGGKTATVVGSIVLPDTLIVSSGYSVKDDKFFRIGADQLWWPKMASFLNCDSLKAHLAGTKTKVFFLFGKKEEDIYGLETKYFYTEKFFKDCPDIKVGYTGKTHEWFSEEISNILAGK